MSGLRFSGLLRGAGYGRSLYVEWVEWGERTTPIDDDALHHAKGRICDHLLVTQKGQRKSEKKRTKTRPEEKPQSKECAPKQPWDE